MASNTIDDDELIAFSKKLKKWRETGIKQTTTLLQKLSEYSIPKEQIKRTKISKVIVKISLEKAESPEETTIIKLSEALAMDWKNKFEKFKKEEKTSKLPENANNSTVVRLENHSKVDKPEPKSFSNDKVREGFCKNLLSILKYEQASQGLDEEEVLLRNLVIEIEEELFKKNKEVTANYREDARTLCSNLKLPNNYDLRIMVVNRDLAPSVLVQCDPLTLQSKISKDKGKKILDDSLQSSQLDWDREKLLKSSVSGGVRCINHKCGSEKTLTFSAQIRRADEGMTEFHECLVCGKKWKH